ncbi:MAG: protein kinase [Deltaproteobacteria bacterium]|nr:protein kinase [Deltaproteobacteria bacterium]
MPIEKGKMVTEHVRLDTLLGEGGMGSVWIADHLRMEEQVAVKFISTELLEKDATVRSRFNREAALAAQIDSPYVVKILDLGTMDEGTPFFVMERLTGENLGERLTRLGPLSLIDARKVVTETAMALAQAHELGIVHRDIKPDNLFLVDADEAAFIKVLDFGIAKQSEMPEQSVVTMTGAMMGTPEFMSPEQVLSTKDVDYRSDLWSLGVVAYYALTERVPFSGETLGALCVAIANGKFVPASAAEPGLPPAIDEWFNQVLAIAPDDRFQSARDMARAFSKALGPLGKPQEDDFSRTGSLEAPDGGDWFGEGADAGADTMPEGRAERPATSAAAKTVASKRSVTFSGASMAATSPRRAWSRLAVGALAFVGVLVGGGAVVIWSDVGSEGPGPAASESIGASTAPTSLASSDSDDGSDGDDGTGGATPSEPMSLAPALTSGAGGAAPEASGAPTSDPAAAKTVASKPRPRPKSSAKPAAPPPSASATASATATATASHAPAPSASAPEKDRGF